MLFFNAKKLKIEKTYTFLCLEILYNIESQARLVLFRLKITWNKYRCESSTILRTKENYKPSNCGLRCWPVLTQENELLSLFIITFLALKYILPLVVYSKALAQDVLSQQCAREKKCRCEYNFDSVFKNTKEH